MKRLIGYFIGALVLAGCNDMNQQPKFRPLDPSPFFSDGRSARSPVADTVARGDLRADEPLYSGQKNGKDIPTNPLPVTMALLTRGRERYDIFCSVCHGRTGDGQGMIVKRGFPMPPSLHEERLRKAPDGHLFDVMTHGYGRMYSYSDRIPVNDRWAIVAYIRALELSQNVSLSELSEKDRTELDKTP